MPIGIPLPFTPPTATSSLVSQQVRSPNFNRIDCILTHHKINPQMVYGVKYLCVKYALNFVDYIDSGFFGSVFMVEQNGYIFALKVALPMDGWSHTPVEPILTMLSSLPASHITGRPLCYFASHETVDYPDDANDMTNIGIDDIKGVLGQDCENAHPFNPKPHTIPLFISATLLSYVPGLDLGKFTELRLKLEHAELVKAAQQQQQQNRSALPSQADFLRQNYHKIAFFSTSTIQLITAQLLLVTLSCHKKGIVHRDIKPSNILLVPQPYQSKPGSQCKDSLPRDNDITPSQYPHQVLFKQITQRIHDSTFLNHHSGEDDTLAPDYFPMIQLLDFGIGSLPVTSAHFEAFANQEGDIVTAIANLVETQSTSIPSSLESTLSNTIDFDHLQSYQTQDASVCSLDLFALALTVLELLLGYIPGSKTTTKMIGDGAFDSLTPHYAHHGRDIKNEIPQSTTTPLLSQQFPLPTKLREIQKFVRKGRMDAILIEYDQYHSDLASAKTLTENDKNHADGSQDNSAVYKRSFTPEMIQTFNLLLSPHPLERYSGIFAPWIQSVIPLVLEQFDLKRNNEQSKDWNGHLSSTDHNRPNLDRINNTTHLSLDVLPSKTLLPPQLPTANRNAKGEWCRNPSEQRSNNSCGGFNPYCESTECSAMTGHSQHEHKQADESPSENKLSGNDSHMSDPLEHHFDLDYHQFIIIDTLSCEETKPGANNQALRLDEKQIALLQDLMNPSKTIPKHILDESIIGSLQHTILTIILFQYVQSHRDKSNQVAGLETQPSPPLPLPTAPNGDGILPSKHLQFTVYNPFYLASIPSHLFSPTQPQTVLSFTPQPIRRGSRIFQPIDDDALLLGALGNRSFDSTNQGFGAANNSKMPSYLSPQFQSRYTTTLNPTIAFDDVFPTPDDPHTVDLVYEISAQVNAESLARKTLSFLLGTTERAKKASCDLPHRYELP